MSNNAGLLELVARGKKDIFFTANPKIAFVHSVYIRASPFTKEIYVAKPRNIPEWGKWVDFDLDHRGDILQHFYLRMELPTWLPPSVQVTNKTGIVTYDASGTTFGYCNHIGFQVIDKIQLFQDQVKIQEIFGEHLLWRVQQKNTFAIVPIIGEQIGSYVESPLTIGRTASGLSLRVPIPIFHDAGIPMAALQNERYRLRIYLRKMEEVIVASDYRLEPNPWSQPLIVQSVKAGPLDTTQHSLPKTAMKTIGISLESTQIYISPPLKMVMKAQALRIPYMTTQFQQYILADNLMAAASLNPQNVYRYPFVIDFIGSVRQFILGFRSDANTIAGRRSDYASSTNGEFIQSLRLNIANIDRVKQWPTAVFRQVTSYWKHNGLIPPTSYIYSMTFGGYDGKDPMGTINFSRAVDAILYLTLAPIEYDSRNISRKTYAMLYAESWNLYEISGGKGRLMFDDS